MVKMLTKKQKFIVAAYHPLKDGFATRKEVREAKLAARGHYWNNPEWGEYISYSLTGRHNTYPYIFGNPSPDCIKQMWIREAKKAARLWSQGKYAEADEINRNMYITIYYYDRRR